MTVREFKRKYWYPISVDIERGLRKARVKIDRIYRKTWSIIFASYVMFLVGIAIVPIERDYKNYQLALKERALIEQILDEPFSERFQHWRTEGSPGQDP